MKILAIIPAYNEEGNIERLVNKLTQLDIDTLVINDCSTDSTVQICKNMRTNYIDLPVNLGIGGAVQTGYLYASRHNYDIAIQIDGDGQHDPAYIELLVDSIINHQADLVIGSRYIKKEGFQSSLMRRIGIKHFTYLIKMLTNKTVTDPTSGFRACNKKVINFFAAKYPVDYPEPETIVTLLRNNLVVKEIPVVMNERSNGISSINSIKAVYYMIKVSLAIIIDRLRNQDKEIAEHV
ncbi:glycosyltransferase family 2 protein [Paenibacillus arenosi]|uniref:Glycosyltransferase family 2 protein n=1 Tax=Paenibacillus arenosi TaxID=2774142 RepID=A0ABR9B530_9BACL|nr:glycosyltransferase family 2 protein [Paenibacillus arenosi]MBD8500989.1 glycosyltransferase family 2 protein [Paenibacillus arenosi]